MSHLKLVVNNGPQSPKLPEPEEITPGQERIIDILQGVMLYDTNQVLLRAIEAVESELLIIARDTCADDRHLMAQMLDIDVNDLNLLMDEYDL